MPTFICLTGDKDNRPIWVNPDHIVTMQEFEDGGDKFTRLELGGIRDQRLDVRDTPKQIRLHIRNAHERQGFIEA